MASDSTREKLNAYREKEIELLQNLQGIIHQAKQELNNDLSRLAIKNMPMMMMMDPNDPCQELVAVEVVLDEDGCSQSITTHNLQPVSVPFKKDTQELEPLDLDV